MFLLPSPPPPKHCTLLGKGSARCGGVREKVCVCECGICALLCKYCVM